MSFSSWELHSCLQVAVRGPDVEVPVPNQKLKDKRMRMPKRPRDSEKVHIWKHGHHELYSSHQRISNQEVTGL